MFNLTEKKKYIIEKNPDVAFYNEVSEAIKENEGYCCCAVERNEDTTCMCKTFQQEKEGGFCHCGRFYKVNNYPIVAIIHAPDDAEHAAFLAAGLTTEGFIVLLPLYTGEMGYARNHKIYQELQKTKIQLADIVFVVNSSEKAMNFLDAEIAWAEEIQKKIIYENTEEVKNSEDNRIEGL